MASYQNGFTLYSTESDYSPYTARKCPMLSISETADIHKMPRQVPSAHTKKPVVFHRPLRGLLCIELTRALPLVKGRNVLFIIDVIRLTERIAARKSPAFQRLKSRNTCSPRLSRKLRATSQNVKQKLQSLLIAPRLIL